ncbi:hypothetical protein BDV35DRAFT_346533 [Aspergillus flavus]|uniref:Uncharacterized protein n=1 Tax=Aspergillus flavus TaxID=5059 RepID=A0A5N6H560_ASPFL|nr:hypothetical protein BDV35DRAFT_346533 [Aspergillus flavus]
MASPKSLCISTVTTSACHYEWLPQEIGVRPTHRMRAFCVLSGTPIYGTSSPSSFSSISP